MSWLIRARVWWQGTGRTGPVDDIGRARALIAAVDAGGIPLDPARVRAVAEGLGLEVSRQAPVEDTLRRIRAALARTVDYPRNGS